MKQRPKLRWRGAHSIRHHEDHCYNRGCELHYECLNWKLAMARGTSLVGLSGFGRPAMTPVNWTLLGIAFGICLRVKQYYGRRRSGRRYERNQAQGARYATYEYVMTQPGKRSKVRRRNENKRVETQRR